MVGLLSLRGLPWRESFLRFLCYVLKPGPLPRFLMTMESKEERAPGPVHTVPGGISQAVGSAFPIFWEKYSCHGRYVSFQGVQAYPHPVQQPAPPIVVGGRARAVLRRTVEQANGWCGFALDLDETASLLAELREAADRYHRPASLGELEISVAPRVPLDKATAQRFAELGVHRLILIPPREMDAPALEQWVTTVGETLVGQV